jgi:hypothetical protein
MRSHILQLVTALLLSTIATNLYAEDSKAHRNQVEKLFKLTQMEKKVQQSVESVLQLQLRQKQLSLFIFMASLQKWIR